MFRTCFSLCLLGLLGAGCTDGGDPLAIDLLVSEMDGAGSGQDAGGADLGPPDLYQPPLKPDLTRIVPWKAINFAGSTNQVWREYDYRPRAQGGLQEDIDTRLEQLKADGVRQVSIQTWFAWSVETKGYPDLPSLVSIVYYNPAYRPGDPTTWGKVPRTRRGDMGLIAFQPPASWDQPTMLRTPLDINLKAQAVLGQMLDAVAAHGLIPVLKSEVYLVIAEDANNTSGDFNNTDPSRGFDAFYAGYKDYLVSMTHLAAQHNAAMFIMGTETPYVAGAGQSYFADGSKMTDRQPLIAAKWTDLIQAARAAAQADGRGDLVLTYAEENPFWELRKLTEPRAPTWSKVPFWDSLDAVGIDLYLPGRSSDGNGHYDMTPKTVQDMVLYGATHNFSTDYVGNLTDLRNFFVGQKGYSLATRPVILVEDGCTSTPYAAANPAAPPFLTLGAQPDFAEQQKLYEAHFILFKQYGAGWLGGLGFWQATPSLQWGGAYNAANKSNYLQPAAYFSFLGTPTEATVKSYFAQY